MNKKNNTRIPKQERSIETRQSILRAGLDLFSEKGYYKTNSKEIAGRAGVSIGSFYMYFNDKNKLFKEILIEYHKKIRDVLNTIEIDKFFHAGESRKFLRYIIGKLIKAHDIYPEFHQEVQVMMQSDPEVKTICDVSERESIDIAKSMIAPWKDKIRVKDIDAAAVIVERTMEEIVHFILFSEKKIPEKRIINELTDMLYRYLFDE